MKAFKEKMCFYNIFLISVNFNLGPSFQENINHAITFFFFFFGRKGGLQCAKKIPL